MRCHVGPGAGRNCPARAFCKLLSSSHNECLFHACTLAYVVECEWVDGNAQFIETIYIPTTKIFVVGIGRKNLTNDASEQCGVFTRTHWQIQIGVMRHLRQTRVNNNEIQTTFFCLTQTHERVEPRNATWVTKCAHQCVAPNDHGNVGGFKTLYTCSPCSVTQRRNCLAWLVDR